MGIVTSRSSPTIGYMSTKKSWVISPNILNFKSHLFSSVKNSEAATSIPICTFPVYQAAPIALMRPNRSPSSPTLTVPCPWVLLMIFFKWWWTSLPICIASFKDAAPMSRIHEFLHCRPWYLVWLCQPDQRQQFDMRFTKLFCNSLPCFAVILIKQILWWQSSNPSPLSLILGANHPSTPILTASSSYAVT